MRTLLIAGLSFLGFIVAYHTHGRRLGRKIFGLRRENPVPSRQFRDDVDYVIEGLPPWRAIRRSGPQLPADLTPAPQRRSVQ
ncbi:MAG: hypothetical protein ACLFV7_06735 [Phycisphaerae bacterium]